MRYQQGPEPNKPSQKNNPRFADADTTPRREGGDDALAEINPTDARADEQVIVNEQQSSRVVNHPSQKDVDREGGELL